MEAFVNGIFPVASFFRAEACCNPQQRFTDLPPQVIKLIIRNFQIFGVTINFITIKFYSCQGPQEPIEKFLADLNEKFSCLNLRDEDKLSYLIQGLRADIQAEVLKKEPKTYAEAEDTARLILSTQSNNPYSSVVKKISHVWCTRAR